ncbi:hypothetical protein [Ferrovibrio sp.]|uniref:hypothetical protein n=1 Tax=Ferrovibrio sp. TaxID=1917215 RepID=UPI0025BE5DB6|nr:hypothetical protein [Ferrovibrio sp.]MBX3453109.1 hypothetical protein [Ferrovibrio sp.]
MAATSSTSASNASAAKAPAASSPRRVALALAALAVALVAFDQLAGLALNWIWDRSSFNPVAHVRRAQPEILALGSSGGHYAIDPSVLGPNAYNASRDGQGGFYVAAMLNALPADTSVKRVIYALDTGDIADGLDGPNVKNLSQYTPWLARDPVLRDWLTARKPMEQYKLLSGLYRFRGLVIDVVRRWIKPRWVGGGYQPLQETMAPRPLPDLSADPARGPAPSGIAMLQHISRAAKARNIQLIVVVSPTYGYDRGSLPQNADVLAAMRTAFKDNAFCDLTQIQDSRFQAMRENRMHFADGSHVNAAGGRAYSLLLKDWIAQQCN